MADGIKKTPRQSPEDGGITTSPGSLVRPPTDSGIASPDDTVGRLRPELSVNIRDLDTRMVSKSSLTVILTVLLGVFLALVSPFGFIIWLLLAFVAVFTEFKGRLRVSLVTLFCVCVFILLYIFASGLAAVAMRVLVPSIPVDSKKMVLAPTLASFSLIMAEFVGLLVAMKLLALYQKRIGFPEIPTLSTMGLRSRSRGAVQLAIGWGLSALLIGGIFGGLWLGGWVKVEGIRLTTSSGMPMPAWLAGYVLLFAIAAFCEEVALRGFVLQNLARVHSELVG